MGCGEKTIDVIISVTIYFFLHRLIWYSVYMQFLPYRSRKIIGCILIFESSQMIAGMHLYHTSIIIIIVGSNGILVRSIKAINTFTCQ